MLFFTLYFLLILVILLYFYFCNLFILTIYFQIFVFMFVRLDLLILCIYACLVFVSGFHHIVLRCPNVSFPLWMFIVQFCLFFSQCLVQFLICSCHQLSLVPFLVQKFVSFVVLCVYFFPFSCDQFRQMRYSRHTNTEDSKVRKI